MHCRYGASCRISASIKLPHRHRSLNKNIIDFSAARKAGAHHEERNEVKRFIGVYLYSARRVTTLLPAICECASSRCHHDACCHTMPALYEVEDDDGAVKCCPHLLIRATKQFEMKVSPFSYIDACAAQCPSSRIKIRFRNDIMICS